nr:Rdx family protein [Halalkalibacterium ligniniphilum]
MSFTDDLLDHFRGNVTEVQLITSKGGAFEVTVNGEKIYSKLETGEFPDHKTLIEQIEKMDS